MKYLLEVIQKMHSMVSFYQLSLQLLFVYIIVYLSISKGWEFEKLEKFAASHYATFGEHKVRLLDKLAVKYPNLFVFFQFIYFKFFVFVERIISK